jgi:hypothetical protein
MQLLPSFGTFNGCFSEEFKEIFFYFWLNSNIILDIVSIILHQYSDLPIEVLTKIIQDSERFDQSDRMWKSLNCVLLEEDAIK